MIKSASRGWSKLGVIVALDLDNFRKIVRKMGWPKYSPNPLSSLLSKLVDEVVREQHAMVVYGLDWKRGTEEAVLALPDPDLEALLLKLEEVRKKIEELGRATGSGSTISIGLAQGPIIETKPARDRRELFKTPVSRLAKRALEKAKRRGGNQIVTLMAT